MPARSLTAPLVSLLIAALLAVLVAPAAGAQVSGTNEDRFLGAGTYQLFNVDLDRYLASNGDDNRANVVTTDVVSARVNWTIEDNGDGTWLLRNAATGGWLDGDGARADWNVDQSSTARSDDRWIITDVGNGEWSLTNAKRGRLLDADRGHQDWNVDLARTLRGDRKWTFEFVSGPSEACRNVAAARTGMTVVPSRFDFDTTWDAVVAVVEGNPNLGILGDVDHGAAARRAGLTLEPNRVLYFGNPAIGTPIMVANRTAGIDLPQKIQVWQMGPAVCVAYNQADYLASRHSLGDLPQLDTVAGALANIAFAATGTPVSSQPYDVSFLQPLTTSQADFDTTWNRLTAAIEMSPASLALSVDHGANSGGALEPTRLAVFGNPNLGTPLMQEAPSFGIDLPLKILVFERNGQVFVLGSDIDFLAARHGVDPASPALVPVRNAIANFIAASTGS